MTGLLPIFVRSWTKKIHVYSILMVVIGLFFFLFGILTVVDKNTEYEISDFMSIMWGNLDNMSTTEIKEEAEQFWNDVQMEYKCCGLNTSHNYETTVIPESCCTDVVKPCTNDSIYRTCCYDAVKGYYNHFLVVVLATVAFTLFLVCLLLIVLALFSNRICGLQNVDENVSVL